MHFNFNTRYKNKPKIYLISPPKIDMKNFPLSLINILDTGIVDIFQLRLKNFIDSELIKIAEQLFKICIKRKVLFILNDKPHIVKKLNLHGVHIGREDFDISKTRKIIGKNKIIGSSCYNSSSLAIKSYFLGANYIAFGSFFKTPTKKNTTKVITSNLKNCRKNIKLPVVAIGGLNKFNIKKLKLLQPDYLAFSSSIWKNKNKPLTEIYNIKNVLDNF